MTDATDELISRIVRTVEYNTENGSPLTIDTTKIDVHFCTNGQYYVYKSTNIATPLERGGIVEHEGGNAPAEPDTYRKYL